MKKRFSFLLALLLCLFACAAFAEPVYKVSEAKVDSKAMLEITFGEQADEVQHEVREYGYHFYDLENEGPPFCGHGGINQWMTGHQSSLSIYMRNYVDNVFDFNNENVIPSGVAPCGLTRDGALAQAEGIMKQLALGEYRLLSITAYGHQQGTVPAYCVSFQQTLNGRPVYWFTDNNQVWPRYYSNVVQIYLNDDGLIHLDGNWCSYTLMGETAEPLTLALSEAEAKTRFASIGLAADELESCYYIRNMGQTAGLVAYPAWRMGNNYLSVDDSWLQIISSPQLIKTP